MTDRRTLYTAPEMASELGFSPNGVYLQIKKHGIEPDFQTDSISLYSAATLERLRTLMDPARRETQRKAQAMRASRTRRR